MIKSLEHAQFKYLDGIEEESDGDEIKPQITP